MANLPMDREDNIHKQKVMIAKRSYKNQKEMLRIKSTLIEMSTFDRFISRLNIAKKKISELEDRSMETLEMETQM